MEIVGEINPGQIFKLYLSKLRMSFHLRLGLPSCFFPFTVSDKMLYTFFSSQFIYLSCLYHPSWLLYSNIICLEVHIMTLIVARLSRNLKVHLPCLQQPFTAPYLEQKESSPQTISLLHKPTLILYRSTYRGGFTRKLLKLKLQGSCLARAPSKAVRGTLNKYSLS